MKNRLIDICCKCRNILFRSKDSICYEEAIDLYDRGQAIIIDVRDKDEYEEGHIQGAINIPVYEIDSKIGTIEKNKSNIIIVYCRTGKRSKMAKRIL